ncbi:MAG: diaminopimelate decarboxylase [Eubacteriales bacterium]|nr:diaminopimelate decarboxylase [Eubacteriales bacterium]
MFLDNNRVFELLEKYGSPLYVYDEKILRQCCKDMHDLIPEQNLRVSYSVKANTNLEILKIALDEDLDADAMSPGEIYLEKLAGFPSNRILYMGNNVSPEEMQYAIDAGATVSVDSLSQLETYGQLNPGGEVCVRFNPGVGAGHHEKVITGGKRTKFGVQKEFVPEVKEILKKYDLKLVGINQHIGSLFMEPTPYVAGVKSLLEIAAQFPGLKFVDMGGGFGVPYHEGEGRLDLKETGRQLNEVISEFLKDYDNKDIVFKIEPGRYIACECSLLLGKVYSVKENYEKTYVGTDLGFNVLMRPVMYDSYHAVEIVKKDNVDAPTEIATIVGNICESGDIIAKDREVKKAEIGDACVIGNAGAYGYSMASNYNCRLRPAEVLIDMDGNDRLIRRRDTFEDLVRGFNT